MPRVTIVRGRNPALPKPKDMPRLDDQSANSDEDEDIKEVIESSLTRKNSKAPVLSQDARPRRNKRKAKDYSPEPGKDVKEEEIDEDNEQEIEQNEPKPKRRYRKRKLLFTVQRGIKRKKKEDDLESQGDEQIESKTPTPSPEPENIMPLPSRRRLNEYTPFQLLLDHYLRLFVRLDPDKYFTYPMTNVNAPDYQQIIQNPMDFMKMRIKMDNGEYENLKQFQDDANLIITNAFAFNENDSVFYLGAKKLRDVFEQVFSTGTLAYLMKNRPFMKHISMDILGLSEDTFKSKMKEDFTDLLETVRSSTKCMIASIEEAGNDKAKLKCLTSEHIKTASEAAEKKEARIVDLIPKLRTGNPGVLAQPQRFQTAIPVTMLDYGPYASFAPSYNSEHATLSLEESIKLHKVYGNNKNADYATSLRAFVEDTEYSLIKQVDDLLDSLTGGRHSKLIEQIEAERKPSINNNAEIDFEMLRSLQNDGIDVSFLNSVELALSAASETAAQKELHKNAIKLRHLEDLQTQRLSQNPPFTVTHREQVPVTEQETQMASNVATSLQNMMTQFNTRIPHHTYETIKSLLG